MTAPEALHAMRDDLDLPHEGDCIGTLCPDCGCCMHCLVADDGECPGCTGCSDTDCGCWL